MLFNNQEEVNEFFERMEDCADKVEDAESALKLLKMIKICYQIQDDFFVPAIVMSYEEMALSYVSEEDLQKIGGLDG